MKTPDFQYRIVDYKHFSRPLKTERMFNIQYSEPDSSAIDTFIVKTRELNKLIGFTKTKADPDDNSNTHLFNLILLGYISAVESFFRKLLRQLITVDEASKKECETRTLTYGAAISYEREMLPESLLENCTFIARQTIKEALKNFLGLKNTFPREVDDNLEQYEKICQIRHCVVHRFGHLGSKNAIELGLKNHEKFLNKPVKMSFDDLQEIFLICNNTVKAVNNYLFKEILLRAAHYWKWNYDEDEMKFKEYFDIFFSKESNDPSYEKSYRDAYTQLKEAIKR